MHPGGSKLIEQYAGMDATEDFFELHRRDVLLKYRKLVVGKLEGSKLELPQADAISPVPFVDPPAFTGGNSPYYQDSHRALMKGVRTFVNNELVPIAATEDLAGRGADKVLCSVLLRLC